MTGTCNSINLATSLTMFSLQVQKYYTEKKIYTLYSLTYIYHKIRYLIYLDI